MYFYLLVVGAIVFGIWFTWSVPKGSLLVKQPSSKLGQWEGIGRILVVAAVIGGAVIGTSNYADRHSKSGLADYNLGHYAAAEAEMGQAENFDPRNVSAHYYRGICLLHDGRKADALNEFQAVCSIVANQRHTSPTSRQFDQEAQAQIQQLDTKP